MTSTLQTPSADPARRADPAAALLPRLAGAALALAVAYVHVKDQGGFPGEKTPTYVGMGYYVLEVVGMATAFLLLAGARRHLHRVWLVAAGVALGPLVGFALSRGPGLPAYTGDRGNWTETLGLVSGGVELALLALAVLCVAARVLPTRGPR